MVTRRELTSLTAAAALGIGALAVSQGANAQQAEGESTFDRVRRTKKLRFGAVATGAPYYMKDVASGKWQGFYYDICQQLAEDLEAEAEPVETTWGNSVLDIQSNKVDIFFGLTATPKRTLVCDFTEQAFGSAITLVGKKPIKNWAEANTPETRISVDAGSSHDSVASNACPKAQITRLKSVDEAAALLLAGRVDYLASSILLSLNLVKKQPGLGQVFAPEPRFVVQSTGALKRERDQTFLKYTAYWIRYYSSSGFIRQAVLKNMQLVGLSESDWPKDLPL